MKLITRSADYAIRAVVYLAAKKDEVIPVPEFVRELKVPRPFMRKILQMLSNAGIIESIKGPGGGFRLARHPAEIRINDIISAFHRTMRIDDCYLKKALCPKIRYCPVKKKIDKVEKFIASELGSVKISELLK